jgi:uncharacterized protein (DUF4415 family)
MAKRTVPKAKTRWGVPPRGSARRTPTAPSCASPRSTANWVVRAFRATKSHPMDSRKYHLLRKHRVTFRPQMRRHQRVSLRHGSGVLPDLQQHGGKLQVRMHDRLRPQTRPEDLQSTRCPSHASICQQNRHPTGKISSVLVAINSSLDRCP